MSEQKCEDCGIAIKDNDMVEIEYADGKRYPYCSKCAFLIIRDARCGGGE